MNPTELLVIEILAVVGILVIIGDRTETVTEERRR